MVVATATAIAPPTGRRQVCDRRGVSARHRPLRVLGDRGAQLGRTSSIGTTRDRGIVRAARRWSTRYVIVECVTGVTEKARSASNVSREHGLHHPLLHRHGRGHDRAGPRVRRGVSPGLPPAGSEPPRRLGTGSAVGLGPPAAPVATWSGAPSGRSAPWRCLATPAFLAATASQSYTGLADQDRGDWRAVAEE